MAPVLGYWDLRGLASTIRNLLYYKGIEFEDKLYTIGPAPEYDGSGWLTDRSTLGLDFPNLPYYLDGDIKLTQVDNGLNEKKKICGKNYWTRTNSFRVQRFCAIWEGSTIWSVTMKLKRCELN